MLKGGTPLCVLNFTSWELKMAFRRTPPSCSLTFLVILVVFPLITAKECLKVDTCSCVMDDGSGIISLHDVDNVEGKPSFVGIPDTVNPHFIFDWNPCTPLNASSGPCQDSNLCQHTPDEYPAGTPNTTFSLDSSGNVVLTYGKVIYKDYTRSAHVTLVCDMTQPKGSFGDGIVEMQRVEGSEYGGTLKAKCACPNACSFN